MSGEQKTGNNVSIVQPKKLKKVKHFIDKQGEIHEGGAEEYFSANPSSQGKPSFK